MRNKKAKVSIENHSPVKVINSQNNIALEDNYKEAMYDVTVFDNEEIKIIKY